MDEKKLQELFNLFNPLEPLRFDQIDELFVERPRSPLPRILASLRMRPSRILLSGQVGTGKTTELRALIPRLTDTFTVFYIDMEKSLNLNRTHRVEVLTALGLGIYKAACEAFEIGRDVKERPDETVVEKLCEPIRETIRKRQTKQWSFDITAMLRGIAAIVVGVKPELASLTTVVSAFPSFFTLNLDEQTQREVEQEDIATEMARRVNDVISDIAEKSEKTILLVVDGTDKVTFDTARDLFISGLLTELRCPMVWLMPMELYHRPIAQQATTYFMLEGIPNITVHREPCRDGDAIWRERQPISEAIDALCDMVRRRIATCGIKPEEVIHDDALRYLARMSGGVVRHLIMLVEKCLLSIAQGIVSQISLDVAEKEVGEMRISFEIRLWKEDYDLMLEVLKTGEIPQGANPKMVDNLIKSCFILGYRNENFWWDIHPILLPVLEAHRRR